MKKILFILPLIAILAACGEKKEESKVEKIELNDFDAKLSYSLGVANAKSLIEAPDPNVKKLNKELIIKGFNSNLSDDSVEDCREKLMALFGPYGQDFDTTKIDSGSECIGRMASGQLYFQITNGPDKDRFDLDLIKKGFEQGTFEQDTVSLSEDEQNEVIQSYMKDMQAKMQAEQASVDKANVEASPAFWNKVKAIPGVKQIGSTGIYIETLVKGSGAKPDAFSDVEAHYTLTNALGDRLESSLDSGNPLKMNLQQLIEGWKIGFPEMQKGGKYNLYIPSDKAYGRGALSFEIEMLNFGPAGTIAPPRQQQQQQQPY